MGKFISWLGKVVEEAPGVPSTTRVIYMIAAVMGIIIPVALWVYLSIHTGGMVEFPAGVITFLTLIIGIITAGKVFQQRGE